MEKNTKPNTLWLLAAFAAPAAHFSGCGWLAAGMATAVILPLSAIPKSWRGLPKPVALAEVLWLGIVAGSLLPESGKYWPSDSSLAVPLTILGLAAFTNAAAAPRVGAMLAFCMALLAVPLAVSGAKEINIAWLRPGLSPVSGGLVLALLFPALPIGGRGKGVGAAGGLTVLLAALVQGIIGMKVAPAVPDAFYQTARSIGYLEPVVAVGMTLGWYAMTIFMFQCAGEIAERSGLCRKNAGVLAVGTAAAFVVLLQQPSGWFLSILSAFLWVLIPFLNKINKREKR